MSNSADFARIEAILCSPVDKLHQEAKSFLERQLHNPHLSRQVLKDVRSYLRNYRKWNKNKMATS